MTTATPVAIPRERDDFGEAVAAICAVYGVVCSVLYEYAATSIRLYPEPGGRIFLALLALGGITTLIGLHWQTLQGLRLELAGLTTMVTLCLAYSLWTPWTVGLRGIGLLLFMGVLVAWPSGRKAFRLWKRLRKIDHPDN